MATALERPGRGGSATTGAGGECGHLRSSARRRRRAHLDAYAPASYAALKTVAAKRSSVVGPISIGPVWSSLSMRPVENATLISSIIAAALAEKPCCISAAL